MKITKNFLGFPKFLKNIEVVQLYQTKLWNFALINLIKYVSNVIFCSNFGREIKREHLDSIKL